MRRGQRDFGPGRDGRFRHYHQQFAWKTKVMRPMTQRRGELRSAGGRELDFLYT